MKIHKLETPKRTFFFERHDGSIIAVGEVEAWQIWNNRNQILGSRLEKPKLIGTSDGSIMYQAVKNAQDCFNSEHDEEKAKEILRKGHQDELEVARKTVIPPSNRDKMGDGASFI